MNIPYHGHRFPTEIISYCVWLYYTFPLSFRDIEKMMLYRGITVTYEATRGGCLKFAQAYANRIRKQRPKSGDKWHLGEVVIKIKGEQFYLWRAVDQDGVVLDILMQRRRIRRLEEHTDEPILIKRLDILKHKRVLFTNHLKFDSAPAFSSALDRSMRFLDEKLLSFGQFRATDSIDPMLNAWAIVNNLRSFLPDAQKAGQSLAEFFGAQLRGIFWMEALNLCSVAALDKLMPAMKT